MFAKRAVVKGQDQLPRESVTVCIAIWASFLQWGSSKDCQLNVSISLSIENNEYRTWRDIGEPTLRYWTAVERCSMPFVVIIARG